MFLEVILPENATDITVRDITQDAVDIRKEYGKTIVGISLVLLSGTEADIEIQYNLPAKEVYILDIFSQSDHEYFLEKNLIEADDTVKLLYSGMIDRDIQLPTLEQ